jgi:hypothetical protein
MRNRSFALVGSTVLVCLAAAAGCGGSGHPAGTGGAGATGSGGTGRGGTVGSGGAGGTVGGGGATGGGATGGATGTAGGGASGMAGTGGSSGATGTAGTGGGGAAGTAGRGGATGSAGASACGGGGGSTASVVFSVDVGRGPARQFQPPSQPTKVSPYVYGINGFGMMLARQTKFGLIRHGGDAFTAWNWTINSENTGGDYCFWQGQGDNGGSPAAAITMGGDSIAAAQAKGIASLATVPIVDHVPSAVSNNTGINNLCPVNASNCNGGTTSSTDVNSGNLDFVSSNPASAAFVANSASKPGGNFCVCAPGTQCGPGCNIDGAGPVYQDEFVNYLKQMFGAAGKAPVFFDLDNEPNYWVGTHPEVWPFTAALPCQQGTVTYDDIVGRDKTFAAAIKQVWPAAKVFGPVVAGDGLIYAHSYNADPHYPTEFLDYYLAQMSAAATAAGQPMLDALDVHYYNTSSTPAQCLDNPRMFWDPSYTSLSASATDAIDMGWSGVNNYFDTAWYPRKIVPRLLAKIAASYTASPAPGLSFSEYNSGCETSIEGGLAEADDLGVFGREGVFAATAWPLQSLTKNYLVAAFDAYRSYDGAGAVVGDTAVYATTNDAPKTSVYAFTSSSGGSGVDLVAINKTAAALPVTITFAGGPTLATAKLYQLVAAQAAVVSVGGTGPTVTCCSGGCRVDLSLAATSVTTIVVR